MLTYTHTHTANMINALEIALTEQERCVSVCVESSCSVVVHSICISKKPAKIDAITQWPIHWVYLFGCRINRYVESQTRLGSPNNECEKGEKENKEREREKRGERGAERQHNDGPGRDVATRRHVPLHFNNPSVPA